VSLPHHISGDALLVNLGALIVQNHGQLRQFGPEGELRPSACQARNDSKDSFSASNARAGSRHPESKTTPSCPHVRPLARETGEGWGEGI